MTMEVIEKVAINGSSAEIEERVKSLLVTHLGVEAALVAACDSSTPLLGHGIGLDSIEVMALALAIESEFDVHIADADLNVELFKNLGSMTDYLLNKRT